MSPPRIQRLERLDQATAASVEAMLERAAVHGRHSAIGEHKFVRLVEGEADTFGLIATLDGRPIGFAQATRYGPHGQLPSRLAAELVVDSAHRGMGVGRALFDQLIGAAREAGLERFDIWTHHASTAATGLAQTHGMRISRELWQMALRLDSVSPRHRSVEVPTDLRLRSFQAGSDEAELVGLVREAFADHPENSAFDAEDLATRAALPWFDPSVILLAEDAASGEGLGLHWMKLDPEPGVGEVYILAVQPRAQGRGVGRILLLAGLEEMRRRAMKLSFLYVEAENEPAIALYRQAGFRHEHLDTCYSLDLRPSGPSSRDAGGRAPGVVSSRRRAVR